jgi:adenosylmethionine---8-amino-7-oxononanoate aminotransferase
MVNLSDLDTRNIWHPFTSLANTDPLPVITSGQGVYLNTEDGRKIIDAISSWWVNLHGHGNESIAQAIATQAAKLEHVIFAGFTHKPAIELSTNLLSILPAGQKKIFFSDNGSTSVEVALKMAFQYWHNLGIKKQKVIALEGAYHGDTFGSMSVGERGIFTEPFSKYLFDVSFIKFPDHENELLALQQFEELTAADDVAAFIYEPLVQGASGMRMYSANILDQLLAHATSKKIICIADEVFTGFGRTGQLFASDYVKSKPDIICVSKGITGGFLPLGVTSCTERIISAFQTSDTTKTFFHGHSYTANPIACAAANASFKILTSIECQARIEHISKSHQRFVTRISPKKNIKSAQCLGTILSIELVTNESTSYLNSARKKIYTFFMDRNILLRPLGNVIYVLPPYVITDQALETIYQAIEEFVQ